MNITITHTIAPEVVTLLEKIFSRSAEIMAPVKETGKVKKLPPEKFDPPAAEVTDPTLSVDSDKVDSLKGQVDSTGASDEPVTLEAIRAATQAKAQAGHKEAIKATLAKFGVAKVTDLPKEKFPEFLTAINAL